MREVVGPLAPAVWRVDERNLVAVALSMFEDRVAGSDEWPRFLHQFEGPSACNMLQDCDKSAAMLICHS